MLTQSKFALFAIYDFVFFPLNPSFPKTKTKVERNSEVLLNLAGFRCISIYFLSGISFYLSSLFIGSIHSKKENIFIFLLFLAHQNISERDS